MALTLHIPTLFIIMVIVSALLALALAYIGHRRLPEMYRWSAALACQAMAYLLFGLRAQVGDWASIVLANVALSVSFALYVQGILRFRGRRWPWWVAWAPVPLVALMYTLLLTAMTWRVVLGSSIYALQLGLILVALLHPRDKSLGRGHMLLLTGCLVMLLTLVLRATALLSGQAFLTEVTDSGWLQVGTFATALTSTLLLALGLVIMITERAQHRLQEGERYQAFRNEVLEHLARNEALPALLNRLVRGAETLRPHMICSVLLLDRSGQALTMGAAPSLPDPFNAAVEGLSIGPTVGSCGAAAYLQQRVVVADVFQHPNWAPFKAEAERAGLRACWSEPIWASDRRVLGTFAVYHRTPMAPTPEDIRLIEQLALLAGIAIERSTAAQQLMESEQHYRLVVECAVEGIAIIEQGLLRYANPCLLDMLGRQAIDVLNRPVDDLVDPTDRPVLHERLARHLANDRSRPPGTLQITTAHRGVRWFDISGAPFTWQGRVATLNFLTDITERKHMEAQIHRLAFHDSLTQLPNRRLLMHNLERATASLRRLGGHGALMFLDLDNFKPLNDTHGHRVGDLLLVEVAQRLRLAVREVDTVSRFGGDEFVVLLSNLKADAEASTRDAMAVADKLLHMLTAPYQLQVPLAGGGLMTVEHRCSASIGVAIFHGHGPAPDELLKQADAAMYRAKEAGRHTVCLAPSETMTRPSPLPWDAEVDSPTDDLTPHDTDCFPSDPR